ncbi:MAG: hypothetical protein P4K83_00525 [Terracidiphilus sp.]|nr:hypothetical protein [Terracidiphilus sp.]
MKTGRGTALEAAVLDAEKEDCPGFAEVCADLYFISTGRLLKF